MQPGRAPLLDYKHLRAGQVYRVRRAFVALGGHEHRVGEERTYLTHAVSDEGATVTLLFRDAEGYRESISVGPDRDGAGDVLGRIQDYLARVPEVADDHQFKCDCTLGHADWAETFGTAEYRVVECFGCGLVVAMQPLGGGSRLIALDEEARSAARAVSSLPANPPFPLLLQAAIDHRTFPANVMLGALLARRPNLEQEFLDALRSEDRVTRLVALEFVSQMQDVPDVLDSAIVRALRSPLDPDPLGDETRWALEALLNVADHVTELRPQIAELRLTLRRSKGQEAARGRSLVQAILKKMDDRIRKTEEEREAAIAVLRRLAIDGAYGKADEWLEQWGREHGEGPGVVARASLAEVAGDALSRGEEPHPEAARWLHERSLELYEIHASGKTRGEASARARHARRVGRKLGRPPSTLPPPPEHYALLSRASLAPPTVPTYLATGAAPRLPTESGIRADLLAPEIEIIREISVSDQVRSPPRPAQQPPTPPSKRRASPSGPPQSTPQPSRPAPKK
jgi:hypothetical protein